MATSTSETDHRLIRGVNESGIHPEFSPGIKIDKDLAMRYCQNTAAQLLYFTLNDVMRCSFCWQPDCLTIFSIHRLLFRPGVFMSDRHMATRIKCVFILLLLMILDIGPIPITAGMGLFIVLFRPVWFKSLIDTIYSGKDSH